MLTLCHEVLAEQFGRGEHGSPGILPRHQDHAIPKMLDKDRIALKPELLGQAHGLTLAILEKLCRFHLDKKYILQSIDVNVRDDRSPPDFAAGMVIRSIALSAFFPAVFFLRTIEVTPRNVLGMLVSNGLSRRTHISAETEAPS